jgi:hypothetical protein
VSTRYTVKRLAKLEGAFTLGLPRRGPDGILRGTLEEHCRQMWRMDKKATIAHWRNTEFARFIAQFEREDAEREGRRWTPKDPWSGKSYV